MGTTIRDVAQAANVSIGTVSCALKNQPGLSEATRERIVAVAAQLSYDRTQLRPRIRRLTFLLHRQHNNFADALVATGRPLVQIDCGCRGCAR